VIGFVHYSIAQIENRNQRSKIYKESQFNDVIVSISGADAGTDVIISDDGLVFQEPFIDTYGVF
jgi:predicted Mrr-cat superfamily restriction endonuclease